MSAKVKDSKKGLSMPLLEELEEYDISLFNKDFLFKTPEYINSNLIHNLRYYQEEAIRNFHYSQTYNEYRKIKHVLFNMATGSGKTDLMAALILFMFKEYNYQNFLFTVNTNAVLRKTIDNLTNKLSNKYLFKNDIEIDGERVEIQMVSTFPIEQRKNTIYIKFSSVQSLLNDLYIPSQGSMMEKDYSRNKAVILADEAHHYSASTKAEKEKEKTWETTISKILAANEDNRLLEFTATVDFENKSVYEKYKDKVIYRYTLDKFMLDKYSKNVKRIESASNDRDNMLNVILLSEFRRYVAKSKDIQNFKPIILFKSPKIEVSNESERLFKYLIKNLTVKEVLIFINRQKNVLKSSSPTLNLAYNYFWDNQEEMPAIIRTIKKEFEDKRIINANDSDRGGGMLEKGQYKILNTLEDPNNLCRVVFAVAKLTEGWDVLNLYDIVRISENAKTDAKATMVEAQLIGRGARYNPFFYENNSSFVRRFEDDSKDSLLLETLHYHTMNEPQYLKNLVHSLEAMDLPTGIDEKNPPLEVNVKSSFRKTDVWKYGKIYYNQTVEVPDEYYQGLKNYGITNDKDIIIKWKTSSRELGYKDVITKENTYLTPIKIDERYFIKAMQKLSFYHFNNLKKYLPCIGSRKEFLYGQNWLNLKNINLRIETDIQIEAEEISSKDKLNIVLLYMDDLSKKIKRGYSSERGINKFIGYPIKDYITNYKKRIPKYDTAKLNLTQRVEARKLSGVENDWFVYDLAIVNDLEYELILKIGERIKELKKLYPHTYLIRMDEQMHRESLKADKLKLHQFQNTNNIKFEAFQPDFILYLQNADFYIQVFIEPKGGDSKRMENEQWKEDLLAYTNNNEAEILFDDEISNVKIKGLKFYTKNDGRNTLNQLAQIVLNKERFESLSFEPLDLFSEEDKK